MMWQYVPDVLGTTTRLKNVLLFTYKLKIAQQKEKGN
jgi:hypothetical protein